jgi:acyl-CoA thioesterase
MGDFVQQTALEAVGEGHWRAQLSEDWMLWGPAGGYVSAIALRAAGEATRFARPVSFACQYLSVARFAPVDLHVESLRAASRTEALRVRMSQEGRAVLEAQVWAAGPNEGMLHDRVPTPDLPGHEDLPDIETLRKDDPPHPFFKNFEWRPIDRRPRGDKTPREPELRGWHRFRPMARAEDAFVDAARALILIDTFTWPATYELHTGDDSPWIAPNLDLYVRFHRDTRPYEWLANIGRADLAEGGLIAASGAVWSPDRLLVASGATQLYCRPRPERFR